MGAFFYEAPLQEAAEAYNVPNPSKSAWFLLWTQELVAYHTGFIYLIIFIFLLFLAMPFFIKGAFTNASWFKRKYLVLNMFILFVFFGITALTVIAVFFRGEYWLLTF